MALASALKSTRFELRRQLGKGGMGVVYEAYDHETDSVIALKTLRHCDAEALYRFKTEFRALADLQHPNLVRFGELYCERGQWFFTMELVDGTDFMRYVRLPPSPDASADEDGKTVPISVRRGDDGRIAAVPRELPTADARGYDEAKLRAALGQLALAIDAVHRSGRVHRDLKPSNVLVRPDGHLFLLDFGLIDDAHRDGAVAGRCERLAGTPAFMAPEQRRRARVGAEADWYSFGVMLFYALTGHLPFVGSPEEILAAKESLDAPAPRTLCADVPDELDALCRRLLARDPEARPSASEIFAVVGAASAPASTPATSARFGDDAARLFVGRRHEIAALEDSLDACRAGHSVSVAIEGEPGVGKSALVRHFLERHVALDPEAVILAGRCYEQEALPFKAFDAVIDALAQYLADLEPSDAALLVRAGTRYLASVFPVLRRAPAVAAQAPGREVDNPLALRAQAFQELKRLLAAMAERVRLVIFIDDLQWADQDSLALLSHLIDPPDAPACLLIATRRSTGSDGNDGAAELLRGFRRVRVGGLGRGEAQALWTKLWGEARDPVGERQLDTLLAEAAGHPLFLSELVRYAKTLPPSAPARPSLQDVLWQRITRLDEPARRFMELVALAGAPIKLPVLAKAAALDAYDSSHLLNALRLEQMIRVSRRGDVRLVEPYHDRVREAIVEHLRADSGDYERIQRLHLAIGRQLLDATSAGELTSDVFTVVHHLNLAASLLVDRAERRRLAELNLLAARQAKLATAYDRALDHLERALALLDGDPWQDDYRLGSALQIARMEAAYLAGRRDDAVAYFEALLPRLQSAAEIADLYVTKIGLDTGHGRFAEAIATGRVALARFGVAIPAKGSTPSVLREYLATRVAKGRRRIADLAQLGRLDDVAIECAMKVLIALAPPAFFADTALLSVCLMRIARLSMKHGLSDVSSYGFAGWGLVLSGAFGKHAEAYELGQLALRLNERFENPHLVSKLFHLNGTFLTPWVRPFAEAEEQLRQSSATGLRYGDTAYEAYAAATLSVITFCASRELAAVQACAESGRVITSRRRDDDMTGIVSAHARFAAALRGDDTPDLGGADSSDAAFCATLSDEKTPTAMFYYFFCNGLVDYLRGEPARAAERFSEAARRPGAVFSIPTTVELCLMECLVAAAATPSSPWGRLRRLRTMRARLGKLSRWARSCPENFAAQHLIARAEYARVRGDGDAGDRYEAAVAAARRYGTALREALALELHGRWLLARGRHAEGRERTRAAIDAYRRWGAHSKAEAMQHQLDEPGATV
jgi:predicted ATPase